MGIFVKMAKSLSGYWSFRKEGSDYIPGIESVQGMPVSAQMTKESSTLQHLHFEQIITTAVEEIAITHFWHSMTNHNERKVYQLCTANFDDTTNGIMNIVTSVDAEFREFTILHLGPNSGQRSTEQFRVDASGNEMKVETELIFDGISTRFTKYLVRFQQGLEPLKMVPFKFSSPCQGWWNNEFRSIALLESITTTTIMAVEIGLFKPTGTADTFATISKILDRFADNNKGNKLVVYIIQVRCGSSKWLVGHRYREFDLLKKYLSRELSHLLPAPPSSPGREPSHLAPKVALRYPPPPPFPPKTYGLGLRSSSPDYRRVGLNDYIAHFLKHKAMESRNVADAILSFLEVPEHLFSIAEAAELKAAAEAAAAAIAAANAKSSVLAGKRTKSPPVSNAEQNHHNDSAGTTSAKPASATKQVDKAMKKFLNLIHPKTDAGTPPSAIITESNLKAISASNNTSPAETPSKPGAPGLMSVFPATPPSIPPATLNAMAKHDALDANSARETRAMSLYVQHVPTAFHLYPQDALYESLRTGVTVLKHGRMGKPKYRLLRCDHAVSRLYWAEPHQSTASKHNSFRFGLKKSSSKKDLETEELSTSTATTTEKGILEDLPPESKSILLSEVLRVQRGNEPEKEGKQELGTAILRRNCQPEDLELCLSLILPARSFDIQCLDKASFHVLYTNLLRHCQNLREQKKT